MAARQKTYLGNNSLAPLKWWDASGGFLAELLVALPLFALLAFKGSFHHERAAGLGVMRFVYKMAKKKWIQRMATHWE